MGEDFQEDLTGQSVRWQSGYYTSIGEVVQDRGKKVVVRETSGRGREHTLPRAKVSVLPRTPEALPLTRECTVERPPQAAPQEKRAEGRHWPVRGTRGSDDRLALPLCRGLQGCHEHFHRKLRLGHMTASQTREWQWRMVAELHLRWMEEAS
ncbi:MAG: hypothetical protein ACOC9T_03190 [Myxococcota bacterium]